MSALSLKILALVTMIIDHVGAVFFPQYIFLRYIGRLSFPIYAFLVSEGFVHSHDRLKYFLRLFAFGLISEIPYDFLLYGGIFSTRSQNIMFELALGVVMLSCVEKVTQKGKYLFIIPSLAVILISELLGLSYGIYGMVLILTAYIVREKGVKIQALYSAGTTIIFKGMVDFSLPFIFGPLEVLSTNSTQCLAIMAALPIMMYNGQKGKKSFKWFFYIIYPAHLVLFILVRYIIKI